MPKKAVIVKPFRQIVGKVFEQDDSFFIFAAGTSLFLINSDYNEPLDIIEWI